MDLEYDHLFLDMSKMLHEQELTPSSITTIIKYAMKLAETKKGLKELDGPKKKEFVLKVLADVINDYAKANKVDANTLELINVALSMAPYIIDATVEFSKIAKNKCKFNFGFCKCKQVEEGL